MKKTKIPYGDYGWNFYPGCLHKAQGKCHVKNCWARNMAVRQHVDFDKPHLIPERLLDPLNIKKPSRILVDFMGDLFGDWVDPNEAVYYPVSYEKAGDGGDFVRDQPLKELVFETINGCPHHTFIFLTKNPAGLAKWSPFPDNCLVGATVNNQAMLKEAFLAFKDVAGRKWLSIEPLYESLNDLHYLPLLIKTIGIDWIVIGSQTKPVRHPKIEWVREILEAAKKANIPVWLKDNMRTLLIPEDTSKPNYLLRTIGGISLWHSG